MVSCTKKVGNNEATLNLARNEQQNKEESFSFVLNSNDTPGCSRFPVVLVALGGGNAFAAHPVITVFGKRYP